MSVSLIVESFTRFFAEDAVPEWLPPAMLSPDPEDPSEMVPNPDAIRSLIVDTWMPTIAKDIGSRLIVPISWNEQGDARYDEQIGYDIILGLQRAAAWHELPHLKRPRTVGEKVEESQDAGKITTENNFPSRFDQLYPMYWLPIDFNFTFLAKNPLGEERWFGSSFELLRQLKLLNDELFKLSEEQLINWEKQLGEPKFEDELDYYARWGLCVFTQLAKKSVEDKLPMWWDG